MPPTFILVKFLCKITLLSTKSKRDTILSNFHAKLSFYLQSPNLSRFRQIFVQHYPSTCKAGVVSVFFQDGCPNEKSGGKGVLVRNLEDLSSRVAQVGEVYFCPRNLVDLSLRLAQVGGVDFCLRKLR